MQKYFNGYALFISEITHTIWAIGCCVPYHSHQIDDKFRLGVGLGQLDKTTTSQAHQYYARHSTLANRWDMAFRHEFVWLWEHDPSSIHYKHVCVKYVSEHINKPEFYFCGFMKDPKAEKCKFCSHALFAQVQSSVKNGEYFDETSQVLGVLGS